MRASLSAHIQDISTKYIIAGETADYAIMFLPSEALFSEIVQNFPESLEEGNRKRVYMASPTTLMPLLAQLHATSKGLALQEQSKDMISCMQKMNENVERLLQRHEAVEKSLEKTKTELDRMQISIGKIRQVKATMDSMGVFQE